MPRVRSATLGLLCVLAAGCVEGEVTYTLNPDGSAKMRFDVTTVVPPTLGAPAGPGGEKNARDESLEDVLRNAIRGTLESPRVSAWKDVSAEFLPNGKLKFSGTAYLRRLSDFDQKSSFPLLSPPVAAERTPGGGLKLTRKADSDGNGDIGPGKRKPKPPDEIKKMTDEQLDREILRDLIEVQSAKSILVALLADAKLKTTFVLPGDPTEVTAFSRDGRKVFFTLDGNKILADLNKLLAEDRPTLRKLYRGGTGPDAFKVRLFGDLGVDGSVTVAKPGAALFDFDKEVKEARAAYPELRKKFGFGDDLRLPAADPPPKK